MQPRLRPRNSHGNCPTNRGRNSPHFRTPIYRRPTLRFRQLAGCPEPSRLFVPGCRLDLVEKALATEADVVIVDLEDAVAEKEKERVRFELSRMNPSRPVHIRINAQTSSYWV
jgi:HpcH/HpaI aldolase/citrate lyase family